MTNMPVLDKNSVAQNLLSTKGTKPVASSAGGNFDAVLRQTTAADKQSADPGSKAEPAKASGAKEKTEDLPQNEKVNGKGKAEETAEGRDAEAKTEAAETKDVPEDITEDTEVLERAGGEMAAMLAAQMEISPKVLAEAMDELGMTELSLLDPKNVKELMVHLTEGADDMSLLTDESFYQSVTEALGTLTEVLEELEEETGMSAEELQRTLQTAQEQLTEKAETVKEAVVEEMPETKEAAEPVKFDAPKPELTENARTETVVSKEMPERESAGKESENPFLGNTSQPVHTQAEVQTETVQTESTFSMADTQEIMDQIMDYMKVAVKPEVTSLEMQLHPESLGTLHIQISNREGAVTAQFIAQNESVKAVLENQIMELKENLEQQGVKVEAVEVTIAQYSLDRNPEGREEASEQGGGRKRGSRNLNLKELDPEDEEDLTEEERLTAEVMQSQGNTVNYTA